MLVKLATLLSCSFFTATLLFGIQAEGSTVLPKKIAGCPVADATLTFPEGQTALSIPPGQVPNHILLGKGVQNYTCSAAGAYTSAGAVAKLYDISCLYGTPWFPKIQDLLFAEQTNGPDLTPYLKPFLAVDHYFITNAAGTGISPKFASAKDGGASFIVAAKLAGIKAPDPTNIDWLELTNVQGDFAKTVFRVDTKGGQPPSSCTPGSDLISVPYTAKYWFYT